MTKDVIELAREAGFGSYADQAANLFHQYAALVAARERERVAQHIASCPAPMCRYGNRVEIGDAARQAYAADIRALNTEGEGHDKQPASN